MSRTVSQQVAQYQHKVMSGFNHRLRKHAAEGGGLTAVYLRGRKVEKLSIRETFDFTQGHHFVEVRLDDVMVPISTLDELDLA